MAPDVRAAGRLSAVLVTLSNPYWVSMKEGYENAAREFTAKIDVREARRAIRAGHMDASVAFSTASVAGAILRSALKTLKGQAVTDAYQVKSLLVHRGNLDLWDKQVP